MDVQMLENICRICLQQKTKLFSLFRKIKGSSPFEKLVTKTQLKIHENDAGPSSICSQCLIELDATVKFLNKCENSNQILSARLQTEVCKSKSAEVDILVNARGEDEHIFNVESNVPNVVTEYVFTGISEKAVEHVVDGCEPVASRAPAEEETARCGECGSLRRCRHWAPPSTHTCPYCQKVFNKKFNFKLHLKRHLGQKDWPCPTCGAQLLTQYLAQQHCKPRQRRECPLPGCGKTFANNTNLNSHIRMHNGERPHVCQECGKSFICKSTLNDHLRIHSGSKPYICPVCGRQFRTNKLAAHLRTHSAARAHACGSCPRAFRSRRALTLHAATHAPPARRLCGLCPAAYAHPQSLRKHLRLRHQIPQPQDHNQG